MSVDFYLRQRFNSERSRLKAPWRISKSSLARQKQGYPTPWLIINKAADLNADPENSYVNEYFEEGAHWQGPLDGTSENVVFDDNGLMTEKNVGEGAEGGASLVEL